MTWSNVISTQQIVWSHDKKMLFVLLLEQKATWEIVVVLTRYILDKVRYYGKV